MQVMHGLHKLILWTSMMAKGAKQDVYWWKKTGFTSSDYSFKERESSLNQAFSMWYRLYPPSSVCLWHAKKDI